MSIRTFPLLEKLISIDNKASNTVIYIDRYKLVYEFMNCQKIRKQVGMQLWQFCYKHCYCLEERGGLWGKFYIPRNYVI